MKFVFSTCLALFIGALLANFASAAEFLVFEPPRELAVGKEVVLISGDEEYRSEESCPMLGKLLSRRHGFRCTVLFAVDADTGLVNPYESSNIPGLEALHTADLMIIGTRFRDLPDHQFAPVLAYLKAAKPVIGFRTATHAFKTDSAYGDFDWNNFGANVIGDNWVAHHGRHGVEGGRGVIETEHRDHPILRGVQDVFTKSDVYTINRVRPSNAKILLRGGVTETLEPESKLLPGKKNDPMMPLAWLRSYESPSGDVGKVFATTAGAANDFESEGLRRLIINATYFLTGLEVPAQADAAPVDEFRPSNYGFHSREFFTQRGLRPEDFDWGRSPQSVPPEE